MLAPTPTAIDNGQTIGLVNTNPMAGPVGQEMAGFGKTLSPSENAQQVSVVGPNNTPSIMSLQDVLRAQQASKQGGKGGLVQTGLAPGVSSAIEVASKGGAEMGQQLIQEASALPQQRAALQQVQSEIDAANPGPLNDKLAKLGGVLTQLGIPSEQATASQLMHKASMLNVLGTVSSGLGTPTDGKMTAVLTSTPNGDMTPQAAKAATGMLLGLTDYKQAKADAWQKYQEQNGPQSFQQFQSEWNKTVPNAAAFQFNHLPQAEQAKYWNSLDKSQKQQLLGTMQNFGMQLTKNGK